MTNWETWKQELDMEKVAQHFQHQEYCCGCPLEGALCRCGSKTCEESIMEWFNQEAVE